jgi:hypothetical protein
MIDYFRGILSAILKDLGIAHGLFGGTGRSARV